MENERFIEKIKWSSIAPQLRPIYLQKHIIYSGKRIKSTNLIDLMDTILHQVHVYGKTVFALNSRWLKAMYGGSYPKMIEWLIINDVIYLWKNYSTGKNSKKYKLTDSMNGFDCMTSKIKMPIILERKKIKLKISKEKSFNHQFKQDVLDHLVKSLNAASVDYEEAKNWLKTNSIADKSLKVNMNALEKIYNKEIYHGFDKNGRFHTNFTVLKKEIRQKFLKIDGDPIEELDVKNSQPFFLSMLMKQNGFENSEYNQAVIDGSIYDTISETLDMERKEVKIQVFKILYARNRIKNQMPVETLFMTLYNDVWNWIVEYKKKTKNYKILARDLQKLESQFIFNKVIPKILEWKNIPIITIHDSILFQKQYAMPLQEIWLGSLKIGVPESQFLI